MTPKQLKTQRAKLNLSQWEMSKLTKISRYKFSLYENGYKELSNAEITRIEQVLAETIQKDPI